MNVIKTYSMDRNKHYGLLKIRKQTDKSGSQYDIGTVSFMSVVSIIGKVFFSLVKLYP